MKAMTNLLSLFVGMQGFSQAEGDGRLLYGPGTEDREWRVICDTVMGGRSSGEVKNDDALIFRGSVSLENNGGFASLRSKPAKLDLSEFDGLKLWLKGTGRTYYVSLRTDDLGQLAYWAPVETIAGEWMEVEIPFDEFYPTFYGRKRSGPGLDPAKINSFGFMLYDKKPGDFRLEVKKITAFRRRGEK